MEKNESIAPLEPFIQTELEKFEIKEDDLHALVKSSDGLVINGVDDKDGYKKVHDTRMAFKKKRVEIEKAGKNMRAKANAFNKAVSDRENKFVNIIEPREKELQLMEDAIDEERERIRIAKEREEDDRIQKMSDELDAVGYAADYITLKGMTEHQFTETLKEATEAFNRRQAQEEEERLRLAEENRKKAEEEERKRKEQEAERIRLENQQKEQEAERIRLENQRKEIEAQQQAIEDEKKRVKEQLDQERRQRLLDLDLKYDYDGRFFVYQFIEAKAHFPWTDFDRLNSEEFNLAVGSIKNRIETDRAERQRMREELLEESRRKLREQEEQTRLENEKKAREEEEERVRQGSDIIKFKATESALVIALNVIRNLTAKSKKGNQALKTIQSELSKLIDKCREQYETPSDNAE